MIISKGKLLSRLGRENSKEREYDKTIPCMNKNIRMNESGGSSLNSTYHEMEADVRKFEVSLEYVVRLCLKQSGKGGKEGRNQGR